MSATTQADAFAHKVNQRTTLDVVHSGDYAMVRSTYKALNGMRRGVVDTGQPDTYKFIKTLSNNRRPSNFANVEHARNLKSLSNRINGIQKRKVSCLWSVGCE